MNSPRVVFMDHGVKFEVSRESVLALIPSGSFIFYRNGVWRIVEKRYIGGNQYQLCFGGLGEYEGQVIYTQMAGDYLFSMYTCNRLPTLVI